MLTVNWNPVTINVSGVKTPPPSPRDTLFGRRTRLREADCSGAAGRHARPSLRECRHSGNVMYDQRVRRGSNFARVRAQTPPPKPPSVVRRKLLEAKRRLQVKIQLGAGDSSRAHAYVQYEEQGPKEPATHSQAVQCVIVPVKYVGFAVMKTTTGIDASTQVNDADLTDFMKEWYAPAKDLVVAVLNQATVCVMYEDDAAAFHREQDFYKRKRLAMLVEADRLDCIEAARRDRVQKALDRAEREEPGPTYRAIQARAMAAHYTANVVDTALCQLEATGYVWAENELAMWLCARLSGYCQRQAKGEAQLDALIDDVIVNRHQVQHRLRQEIAAKRRHDAVQPEEERRYTGDSLSGFRKNDRSVEIYSTPDDQSIIK